MNSEFGQYVFAILMLFMIYVFTASIIEGLKKKYNWRWGIIILFALWSFFEFGIRFNTFTFTWQKIVQFMQSPPWSEETSSSQ